MYDRGDYNNSFALRAIELKMKNILSLQFKTEAADQQRSNSADL